RMARCPFHSPPKLKTQNQKIAVQITSNAPPFTDTLAGVSFTLAAPLLSSIPATSQTIFRGVATAGGFTSRVNPPAPGRSLRVIDMHAVLNTFISARAGTAGTSPTPQNPPAQIG